MWFEGAGVADSARRFLYADEKGSIVAVSDMSGNVTAINAYDEYGLTNAPLATEIATHGRFRYTGQAYLPELGMYYYKARFYSPTLGRFLQVDPIGYDDQFNLYGYVGNDPVNRSDPTGTYGRGTGWTDGQWRKFDNAQQAAADKMESRAESLERKAEKRDAQGRGGGDRMRDRAAALRSGAGFLRSDGSDGSRAHLVSASDWTGNGEAAARMNRIGGNQLRINAGHSTWTDLSGKVEFRFVLGHESLHSVGLDDQRGRNGQSAYRYSSSEAQRRAYSSITGTPKADRNSDHLMSEVYP